MAGTRPVSVDMPRPLGVPEVVARKGTVPLVMVTAYDAPIGAGCERGGRRPDPRGRLPRDGGARLRRHPARDGGRHRPSHGGRRASEAGRARGRRHAVDELPRLARGHRAQRGAPRPGGSDRGEARGRPQAPRHGPRDPRRGDPGDGAPGAHAAVRPRVRRVQGAGKDPRRRSRDRRRRGCPRRGRVLRDRARVCTGRGRPSGDRRGPRPDHRDRRGRHCDGQVLVFHDLARASRTG